MEEKCTMMFLGATEKMQIDFIAFAKKKNVTYNRKDLNLLGTINVLAFRVQTEAKAIIDPLHIKFEAKYQEYADESLQNFKSKGYSGRTLTPMQAEILLTYK